LRLWDLITEERPLSMVWLLQRKGRSSYLVGSAHFFPYRFRRALRHLASEAECVIVEGPLDLGDLREVAREGSKGGGGGLSRFPEERSLDRLELLLGGGGTTSGDLSFLACGLRPARAHGVRVILDKMSPWMAFFTLWVAHLERMGWIYHMDRDALEIGRKLGCRVLHLESLQEQLAALEHIPA